MAQTIKDAGSSAAGSAAKDASAKRQDAEPAAQGGSAASSHDAGASAAVCVQSPITHPAQPDPGCDRDNQSSELATRPPGVGYDDDTPGSKRAYLTFDDGPSDWTPQFLDILAQEQVKATFFICAQNLKKSAGLSGTFIDEDGKEVVFRDVLKRTVADGHAIGNHTVDHTDLASVSAQDAAKALDDNERLINEALVAAGATPRPLTLVRPPYGSPWHGGPTMPDDLPQAQRAAAVLIQDRGVNVLWDLDSSDSKEWAQDESYTRRPIEPTRGMDPPSYADKVARIKSTVLSDPRVGDGKSVIILMHDTHNATRDALRDIIAGLRDAGYEFGTIEELVLARWGRSSLEVTPGPHLYSPCLELKDQGCSPRSPEQAHDVCGRMWKVWNDAGGQSVLGSPLAAPMPNQQGAITQMFEHGTIELHPERGTACSASWIPAR